MGTIKRFLTGIISVISAILLVTFVIAAFTVGSVVIGVVGTLIGVLLVSSLIAVGIYQALSERESE
jgi:Na+/phosphate symporter